MIDQGNLININSQEVANSQNSSWEEVLTELELSVESRSFVNQQNDQVRKDGKEFQTLQAKEKNIRVFGGCLWL